MKENIKKNRTMIPYNLQLFAEPGDPGQPQNDPAGNSTTQPQSNNTPGAQPPQVQIDYDKLFTIAEGRRKASEESAIKGYLKEQGLSKEEMSEAIRKFKEEKAAREPNVEVLQKERDDARLALRETVAKNEATLEAMKMGIKEETIPYLLKLADLTDIYEDNGEIKEGAIKEKLEAVLKDIPQLKPQESDEANSGFRIGGNGNGGDDVNTGQSGNTQPVAQKRWNRFR